MSVSGSGIYLATWIGALKNTLALDLSATTHKIALFDATITPDFSAATPAYGVGPYSAGECVATGWPAGGVALSAANAGGSVNPTVTENPAGVLRYTMDPVSIAVSTQLAGVRCALLYADALAGNDAILLIDFGSSYTVDPGGTFGIQWASAGVLTLAVGP